MNDNVKRERAHRRPTLKFIRFYVINLLQLNELIAISLRLARSPYPIHPKRTELIKIERYQSNISN